MTTHFSPSSPCPLCPHCPLCKSSSLSLQPSTVNWQLFVLLINHLYPARLIKHQIKHLMLPHDNLSELFFLCQRHRLQLNHFQNRQERHNHRVPRRTRLKKLNQIHRILRACQNLRPQSRDHLRHGKLFVPQLDPRNFFLPLQDLLENFHQVHERNHQFAFGPFVVVKRFVRLRPNVFFNLLLLVQKLRRVFKFFVFHQALHQFRPRIAVRLFRPRQRIRRQKHFRLDVNQRSRHINKFRRHIHIQFFQFVQVIQVLRGDFRNLDVVNTHLLLSNQIQQQVEWTFVHRDLNFVGRFWRASFHSLLTACFRVLPRHLVSRRRHSLAFSFRVFSAYSASLRYLFPCITRRWPPACRCSQLPFSFSPTQTLLRVRAPSSLAQLPAPSSNRRPEFSERLSGRSPISRGVRGLGR